jgi:cobalamin biosynthesis protein CobD/CbiB
MQRRVWLFLQYLTFLFLSQQRIWAERRRQRDKAPSARSTWAEAAVASAKIIKGTKKAAYYPEARCSPLSLARRLASPFFLSVASP